MNSFYGGREGAPFIIRKSYIDVPTMIEDFGRGLSNSEVRFGEFVIINTEDKNHPDNGKIFRRNFMGGNIDYYNAGKDEKGNYIKVAEVKNGNGAELIGTIVGPAGAAPHFQPVPFTTTELKFDEYGEPVLDEDGIQIEEEKTYTLAELMEKYSAYDTTSGSGSFEIPKGNLIPGKDGDTFKDNITWTSYSVRTPNADDTTAFIDFQMPYDVIEFDASTVDAYHNRSDVEYDAEGKIIPESQTADFNNLNLVVRHKDDKGEHPFYQKWQINVPKGIKGQSIENLRVVNEGTEDEPNQVLKYDLRNYDAKQEGEVSTHLIGDYNMIDNIQLSDTGYLDIDTTTSKNEIHQQLHWIKDIDFSENGTITTTEVDGKTEVSFDELITWINAWNINHNTGELYISLNNQSHLINGTQQETTIPLKTVNEILVEDGNKLILQYNTYSSKDEEGNPIYHTEPLGRFVYQGETQPNDLITGGLWIETETIDI